MMIVKSLQWGLFLGLALIVTTQTLTWIGLGLSNWFNLLYNLLNLLLIAWGLRNIKRANDHRLTFFNALLSVVVIVLTGRLLFQVYMFFYTQYLEPGWVDMAAQTWTEMMVASEVPEQQINRRIQGFRQSYQPLSMFTSSWVLFAVPQVIMGTLLSLFFVLSKRNLAKDSK